MGFVNASPAAAGVSRPTPSSSQRSQKVADRAFSLAANPGVPASASRNGAPLRSTSWLTFNKGCPTVSSSVCASSSISTSGCARQRAASNRASDRNPPLSFQPARPSPMERENVSGDIPLNRPGGASSVASASRLRIVLGVTQIASMTGFSTSISR